LARGEVVGVVRFARDVEVGGLVRRRVAGGRLAGNSGDLITSFPLTPALSRRERENCSPMNGVARANDIQTISANGLPLPWEEGRGDGKADMPTA